MDFRDDFEAAFSIASSHGGQEDDAQEPDGYIVEALESDYTIPEYVYADATDENESATAANVNAESGAEEQHCVVDDSEIDPTSISSASNETPNAKLMKLSTGDANFTFNGQFYKRRFIGKTPGGLIATRLISGGTVNEILTGIWDMCKPLLCREVIFVENSGTQVPTWADRLPVFEEMGKFVVLQDHSQKKRVTIEKVSSKLLTSWRCKEIRVHVHVYSTSISCKSLWEVTEKQLIRHQNADRSGAPSNQAVTSLAEELRRKNGHFQAQSSAWRLWANFIHAGPAHEREQRLTEMPPQHLLKFFRSVPISEAVKLESVRSGLSVANTINQGFVAELEALENDTDQLLFWAQRLKSRLASMRTRSDVNSALVGAMSSAVRPEEDEFNRDIAGRVSDMPDVDHA
ncbi:uncharacterized protein LOC134223014 [Armigeres subalbatus]|uniref:uncharacterized protein LOC134223014 n=1 Tax=Armigeres subalbatus TaxID=124917 RepID=UPI002ED41C03